MCDRCRGTVHRPDQMLGRGFFFEFSRLKVKVVTWAKGLGSRLGLRLRGEGLGSRAEPRAGAGAACATLEAARAVAAWEAGA